MKNILSLTLFFLLLTSCNTTPTGLSKDDLFEVEKQFSAMSEKEGMVRAFTYFCDSDGVMLRPESYPVVGKDSIVARMKNVQDSLFTLTWKPIDGAISSSGDLGYTYGVYTMSLKDKSIPGSKGTYLTIWKLNKDGEWRFVMDTGQEGLGE